MSFSLIYICCSFQGGILSVVFPTVAICFWPAGNLECPCLFSDLILFPFLLLFFYIVPYPSFSSMSFSLIYICCSFRGGILSAVFPTVTICFWPAGNLECPCLFSDLILFPFLLLFFYIVPYPSFSSMSFSLIYICCSFRGGILFVVFPAVSICFWPAGNLECPCLFSDLILFPFLLLFFYIVPSVSFSLTYICCSFRGGILSAVFPTVAICFWPAGNLECPCLFSDLILFPFLLLFFYIVPYSSFSSMSFSLIYICCSFRGGILSVVFPAVAICFWPAGNLECPCLFSDLILFPFLLLFFYIVPYPSFSSMSFSLIYICCSFRGGILSVVFCTVAICVDPQGTWSALVSFPTLSSSLFSSFSSILFLTLPFLLCLFHWSISAVVSGRHSICCFLTMAICFWPAGNLECPCLFSDLILFPFLLLFFYIVPYPSFSSMSFSLIYICCSFRGGILSVVFRTVAICFWPAGNLECPCLFSDLILFPFLLLFFYIVPYSSFSSMSFSLIYICCSFRGGILSVVFCTVAICVDPQGTWSALVSFPILSSSLFSSFSPILFLTLPFLLCLFHWSISAVALSSFFSPPFLLYCSLPFLFFYVFFIDLYLL